MNIACSLKLILITYKIVHMMPMPSMLLLSQTSSNATCTAAFQASISYSGSAGAYRVACSNNCKCNWKCVLSEPTPVGSQSRTNVLSSRIKLIPKPVCLRYAEFSQFRVCTKSFPEPAESSPEPLSKSAKCRSCSCIHDVSVKPKPVKEQPFTW